MQRTRRFLVALAGGAAVAAACAGSAAPASAGCKPPGCGSGAFPDASWRPYSATSTFNQRLGATSALGIDRSSSRIVGDLVNDRLVGANGGHSTRVVPENIGISRKGWLGWPTYYAKAGQAVSVTCDPFVDPSNSVGECPTGGPFRFDVAPGSTPSPENVPDRHMTVIDQAGPNGSREYDLWEVQPPTRSGLTVGGMGWESLTAGGVTQIQPGRGNAAGFGNLAGRIRGEELAAAIAADHAGQTAKALINHAITVAIACDDGAVVPPALPTPGSTGSSGTHCASGHAPAMGARLQLNATAAQIAAAPYAWQRVLLRTMRRYGVIVDDTGSGGGFMTMQTEGGLQYHPGSDEPGNDPWWGIVANDPCATSVSEGPEGWQPWFDSDHGDRLCVGHFDDGLPASLWSRLRVVDFGLRSLSPTSGPATGGTKVAVSGVGLKPGATVRFGGVAGTSVAVIKDGTRLTVTAPAHAAGQVPVTVTQGGVIATAPTKFRYAS